MLSAAGEIPTQQIVDRRLLFVEGWHNNLMENGGTPATKQDLAEMEERLTERMRDMQTELLKALLPFREQIQIRQNTVETRASSIEARFATVETRLSEIEKKLLLNPPA